MEDIKTDISIDSIDLAWIIYSLLTTMHYDDGLEDSDLSQIAALAKRLIRSIKHSDPGLYENYADALAKLEECFAVDPPPCSCPQQGADRPSLENK